MQHEPKVLVPYDQREAVAVSIAARLAGKSPRTIQLWAAQHSLGRRVGGQWRISKVALAMYLDGDEIALRDYLRGDRTSERVAAYFNRAGLKTPQNPQNPQSRHGADDGNSP